MTSVFTRRSFLQTAAGAAAATSASAFAAYPAPAPALEVLGAVNGSSVVLARLIEAGGLSQAAPGATFKLWRTADELRAGIESGRTRLFTTPTHVAAKLYNSGQPIRLLSILSTGHISVVTGDESIRSFADLKGKSVLGFSQNDLPDILFRAIARAEGIDPDRDITLRYAQTPIEAAQKLGLGEVDIAILPEPPATGVVIMAALVGRSLSRAFSLQDVWRKHKGTRIPQTGIAVHASLLKETPELIPALKEGLPKAKDWLFANRDDAGELGARTIGARSQIFAQALDRLNIEILSAKAAKGELEVLYKSLLDFSPDAIGGKLPGDDFYLDL